MKFNTLVLLVLVSGISQVAQAQSPAPPFLMAVEKGDAPSIEAALKAAPRFGLHSEEMGDAINRSAGIINAACASKEDVGDPPDYTAQCRTRARTYIISTSIRLLKDDPSLFFAGLIKGACSGTADGPLTVGRCFNHAIYASKIPTLMERATGETGTCKVKAMPAEATAAHASVADASMPNSRYAAKYFEYYSNCVGAELDGYIAARKTILSQRGGPAQRTEASVGTANPAGK